MTPKHNPQLEQQLCETILGKIWSYTFLWCQKDRVSSHFYKVQDLARLKANTTENRAAFLTLVSLSSLV